MTASFWLVAALACAQFGGLGGQPARDNAAPQVQAPDENVPAPRPSPSKITAVTVYQGQALVSREVSVPDGDGTVELVVTPLPAQTVDSSLFAEGGDGLRVLSTRFRTRAVKDDTRREVRAKEDQLKKLKADEQTLKSQVTVQQEDLQYLKKLEGFTGASVTSLTEKGRLDSEAILTLSKFLMEHRATKAKAETELRQQLQANTEAAEFAQRQLAELSAGSSRTERDAVIVVQKTRHEAASVRLSYLVGAAGWSPQYRLRGAADNAPVRLEYLAAVTQQTGEAWTDARITLSNARPSIDAAPPELLPLKMAVGDTEETSPVEAGDILSQRIVAELGKSLDMQFANETPLEDVLKYIRGATASQSYPGGIPIYLDPIGLQEAEKTSASPVTIDVRQVPLRTSLRLILEQLGLTYEVRNGLLKVVARTSSDDAPDDDEPGRDDVAADAAAAGQSAGGALLNQVAATDQAQELRVTSGVREPAGRLAGKGGPSVTFAVAGRFDIPSRRDPQLLEVARAELPADYYAKAVPVLTPHVYRLAKLTNKSDLVLLPGEANIYVGTDFVGRMRLPLVAAGEPFVAGFGVDPQLQVSRRLLHKARSVQGGNQVFTYEFRIGLRNFRSGPVKVQLWDRLPKPHDEVIAVNLVKTSAELSTDALYQRSARMDNLLRWDVEVPPGTVGEKTMYLNYEFRLEYARDLPQPHFASGGLREGPIGGGAMGGGLGGMGGFR